MAKIKLPITEKLKLESEEAQWRMLARGLINALPTTALIEIEPNRTIRIKLVIKRAIPPESMGGKTKTFCKGNLEQRINNGLARVDEFFSELMAKSQWIFTGYIDDNEEAPILIIHYSLVNITVYTQKLTSEDIKDFSLTASLN